MIDGRSELIVGWWLDSPAADSLPKPARPRTRSENRVVMTPREVARLIGVRDAKIYELLRSGELAGRDLGTREKPNWRILRSTVEQFLRRGETPPPAPVVNGRHRAPPAKKYF